MALERLAKGDEDGRASAATEICTYFEGFKKFSLSMYDVLENDLYPLGKEPSDDKAIYTQFSNKGKTKLGHCEAHATQPGKASSNQSWFLYNLYMHHRHAMSYGLCLVIYYYETLST